MGEGTFATGSHDWPPTEAFDAFMAGGWTDTERRDLAPVPVAGRAAKRRELLRAAFPGERIVVPSGVPARRSNDQDHRFRPHSDYVWLTGDQHPGRVLVVDPDGATLYARPRSRRDDGEFYRSRTGALWVGRRPSLADEYLDGTLAPGHVLTVEPGLYFQPDDLLVPAEFRGLGYRIEENVRITADGYEMLSDDLPRTAIDVESWLSTVDTAG
jgi:Xaa-Pro aminopeptidase